VIKTIPRYGVRHVTGSTGDALKALKEGRGIQGPGIEEFEKRFAEYHGVREAVTTSYGRMAFYYILRALDVPAGSEIIFPALTFWVVPEMARVCGMKPVFVDVDERTFNIDPARIEAAITPRTRAIVPTHLYGQPCDMDRILPLARKHKLLVIEDCAHALGARYKNIRTGTFGDAALFSFQMLKGLNAYGGGMAVTNDAALGAKIRAMAAAEPWPSLSELARKFAVSELQRGFINPYGFTFGLFGAFYIGSFFNGADLSRFLWEKIRPLSPLPPSYTRRFSNAQAIIGLYGLAKLDELNQRSRANAQQLTSGLTGIDSIIPPFELEGTQPVYYQYCIRTSDPATLSRRAIRQGIDIEIMHVDVCSKLDIFTESKCVCPVAEGTEQTLQLPVYSRLQNDDLDRILDVIRTGSRGLGPLTGFRNRGGEKSRNESRNGNVLRAASNR
jgi:dTDP-4-amino-4,6-dideoxygalactose transaminase